MMASQRRGARHHSKNPLKKWQVAASMGHSKFASLLLLMFCSSASPRLHNEGNAVAEKRKQLPDVATEVPQQRKIVVAVVVPMALRRCAEAPNT